VPRWREGPSVEAVERMLPRLLHRAGVDHRRDLRVPRITVEAIMKIISHLEIDADGVGHPTLCVVEGGQVIEQVEDNEAGRTHLFTKYDKDDMEYKRWCGNDQCCCSTGIHEGNTYGHGRLDQFGYWQHPCRVCAAAADHRRPELLKELIRDHGPAPEDDPTRWSWAEQDAWPYVGTDIEAESAVVTARVQEEDEQWDELHQLFGEDDD